jgi:hypothetical protein
MFRRPALIVPVLLCVLVGAACTRPHGTHVKGTRSTVNRPHRPGPHEPRPSTTLQAPGTTRPSTPTTTAPAPPHGPRPVWRPAPGSAWQIQLSTPVDTSVEAPVYEIDGDQNDASVVAALHAKGRKVICYIDAGAAERYRADFKELPVTVLGSTVSGWPDERWLDVRQIQALTPVMSRRMDMCRAKGFDAVDPDMLEAYAARSGFPITAQDQLNYNRWIAKLAHDRGLSVAMKGNVEQVAQLEPHFDFAVNEQCAEYDECDRYRPFLAAGKAVFQIEYDTPSSEFCPEAKRLGIHAQRKHLALDVWRETC